MSFWTHVNGSLRVDSANCDISNLFRTCNFYSPKEAWEACNVPCGKEGSLQVRVLEYGEGIRDSRQTISFFGDLRSYSEEHVDFIAWLDELIIDNDLSVRSGVLTLNEKVYVYCEHRDTNWDVIKRGFELVYTEERKLVL